MANAVKEKKQRQTKELNVTGTKQGRMVLMASLLDKQIKNKSAQLKNVKEEIKAEFAEPTNDLTIKYTASRVSKSGKTQVGTCVLTYVSESTSLDIKKVMLYLQQENPNLANVIKNDKDLYTVKKASINLKTDLTEI